ncbi:MAG: sugar ABC transporter permease [Anaerolineales bacterium]|jgi:ABC-type sugar transport system permease subunit
MKTRKRLIVLFLLPASLVYLAFFLVPAVWAFYYSFFDWSGFTEKMKFIGIHNYTELMHDPTFLLSLKNTLFILVVGGIIIFALAFLLTVLVNSGIKGKKLFRAMIFLPNVIATIALTTLWAFIYNPNFGLINGVFKLIGWKAGATFTFTSIDHIFYAMMAALIIIQVGFYLVLLMAGMDKIPAEFYEAARLEGANQWQMFTRISLPLLWDVISIGTVLYAIFALKVFEFPYAFNQVWPPQQLYTVGIYLFIEGFGKRIPIYRLGYATAIGVVLLLFVGVIVLLLRRLMRREVIQY